MKRTLLARLPAVAAVLLAGTLSVHAGTSSWYRETEVSKPPPGKSVKIKPAPKVAPKPAPAPGKKTDIKTLVEPTGEDAAYIAFDQGQYLTALKLAEEAAARGEANAHTLIGRIYSEGLPTSATCRPHLRLACYMRKGAA
jgi:hypothetical protein